MTLRERIHDVKGDSEEAFRARRQLVRLLAEGIVIEDRCRGDEPRVRIAYRFDPPEANGEEQGGGDLCEASRNTKESILQNAASRLGNSREEEVEVELGEIARIARLRLRGLVEADEAPRENRARR